MNDYEGKTKCELIREILKYKPNAKVCRLWARSKDKLIKILEKLEKDCKDDNKS